MSSPSLPPPAPEKKTSVLAILSVVFSFLCLPVGLVLGIIALVRINKNPALGGRGLAIAGIAMSSVMLVVCVPLQAAIAIPNFLRFQARAKQSECKMVLKEAFVAERGREGGFTDRVKELGLSAEPHQRYAYFFGQPVVAEGENANVLPPNVPGADLRALTRALATSGLTPGKTADGFTLVCVGNVDSDDTLDVWSISDAEREGIPAGMIHHDVDDVTQ